ncbi:glycine cleavage system protein GcvH [Pseudenhygromyxa sp. WMMC2535]|uniref:glycine cleavage system protein GcvH n=1 Tax=Pseudenhygromyxa sp. WMMC2535 TaxID=2712867 RepID=UPI0015579665|nr:glycine cleavage system protein GcvH [Pseudenhygromyxa sp. WMMC2535]NVB41159.1 glycine cleavage system protein GcvH [Pseudenhygromyxa sp. WMMC2535]
MSDLPENYRFTNDHEWARRKNDGNILVGITAHAVEQLGDITAVGLPEVGDALEAGDRFGDIDSVKAVSDLYAPIAGKVVAVNGELDDAPEAINEDPYQAGWMIELLPDDPAAFEALLDAAAYRKLLAEA